MFTQFVFARASFVFTLVSFVFVRVSFVLTRVSFVFTRVSLREPSSTLSCSVVSFVFTRLSFVFRSLVFNPIYSCIVHVFRGSFVFAHVSFLFT